MRAKQRTGFTLIELLVVIAIIAILAALIGAAVQKARDRGRDVEMRADMTGLDTAIGQFKARFGVYPPCSGSGPQGTFRLATTYSTTDAEFIYLQSMFERINAPDNGLRKLTGTAPTPADASNLSTKGIPIGTAVNLDPNQCLVFFLSGGIFTGYTGFSPNQQTPFLAPDTAAGAVSGRLAGTPYFDFKPSKMMLRKQFTEQYFTNGNANGLRFSGDPVPVDETNQPWFSDPWGTPYLYFASKQGNDYPFAAGMAISPWSGSYAPPGNGTVTPFYTGSGSNLKYQNIKSYQLVSAGHDKKFGTGGSYTPGSGTYALNRQGGDDFSNFQQTPLGVTD